MNVLKELEKVNAKIAEVEKRREDVKKAQRIARLAIEERAAELGAQLLNGDAYAESIKFLSGERVRLEGLEVAEKHAAATLAELEAERNSHVRTLAIEAYEKEVAEARKKLLTAAAALFDVSSALASIRLVPPAGYVSDGGELVRNFWFHLRDLGITGKLSDLEPRFPEFMSQARKAAK
ncbi:MAG: hypothetical protein HY864_09755 [Chloroflexi bacterium]|nr:hypothetical protein [Chloroflexota bacterium]